ncbi:MAG TPA: PilZ domain-containing protein, partial [Candidatus Sulfotelmatobacter sp.]|nr:PilZ domain-containing protein [Candidatus Sulfotelmatobacter sp.]
ALPDWRIVEQSALVPLVAFWCTVNITVLFLVCMMCLQAPIRRGEERFDVDEPVWLRDDGGGLLIARLKDISLSGLGMQLEAAGGEPIRPGAGLRVFLKGVGFVSGTVARARGDFVGVRFALAPSVERDLLIRKIFTSGLDTTAVRASPWSATLGLIKRIWTVNAGVQAAEPAASPAPPPPAPEKLPAAALRVAPRPAPQRLADLAAARQALAA